MLAALGQPPCSCTVRLHAAALKAPTTGHRRDITQGADTSTDNRSDREQHAADLDARRAARANFGTLGVLFALPAACTPDPAEQALWVFQALVSVLADYVYIGGPSPAHGVDRVLASFNFLRLAFLLSQQAPELFALGLVPAALFVYAQRAKDLDRPEDRAARARPQLASGAAVACAATYSGVS